MITNTTQNRTADFDLLAALEMKCVSLYRFSDPGHKNSNEKSLLVIFSNKINKFRLYMPYTPYP
jgi:hypothetical protein